MQTQEAEKVLVCTDTEPLSYTSCKKDASNLDSFIAQYVDKRADSTHEFETSNPFNLEILKGDQSRNIINYRKINNIRYVNKFFEAVNLKMDKGDYFICCLESKTYRSKRIRTKYTSFIGYPMLFADFIINRVVPKLPGIKKMYFSITNGNNRAISLSEGLGRLISCGFDIIEFRTFKGLTYIITKKKQSPYYDKTPSYGALIKLHRVGQGGKMIKVYKLRTMHPYSEYLQHFIFETNDLKDGGKINNDYRVTTYGKWFRKLWIDELPMLINWAKRELKIVGVRPLSQHYFNLYPEDVRELRIKTKPGLVPPFYADMPVTFEEIVESERKYLEAYKKAPIRTDIAYFFKSFYNIFFKKARSA